MMLPGEPVPGGGYQHLGARVARELDTLVRLYGKPACIVSDNVLGREAAAKNGQQVSLRRW
jgi:putative transposase